MWRKLQQEVPHVFFNARWLKRAENEDKLTDEDFGDLWKECQEDIKGADILLMYAENGDQLKGALVEVGMALAYGVQVIVVTPVENARSYGTWIHKKGILFAATMEKAMAELQNMTANANGARREGIISDRDMRWFAPAGLKRGSIPDDAIRAEIHLDKPEGCCGGAGPDCHCKQ